MTLEAFTGGVAAGKGPEGRVGRRWQARDSGKAGTGRSPTHLGRHRKECNTTVRCCPDPTYPDLEKD